MSSSRRSTLTPEATRELDAVDAALAGAPVAAEHEPLVRFARELRDARPRGDEQFLAALDARAAEGFEGGAGPRGAGKRLHLPHFRARARTLRGRLRLRGPGARPALGVALAALLVLAVAVPLALQGGGGGGVQHGVLSGGARSPGSARANEKQAMSRPAEQAELSGPARTEKLRTAGASVPSPAAAAPAAPAERRVERTATLDVGVTPSAIDSKSHQVFTLVSSLGGYVRTSNVSSGSGQGGASFDIRVPSSNLSAAISQLSGLGHVRSENNTTNDVTEQLGSLQHSIGDLRAERESLLKQIAQTSEGARVEELKAHLHNVEGVLAHYEGSLRALTSRIDYAPLALTLTPEAAPASTHSGELTPGSAAHDAGRILEAALAVLVIAAAALLPLGAIALAAWMILGSARRRLREHALDAS
jgi:Domain of unknown function (DUF4349)